MQTKLSAHEIGENKQGIKQEQESFFSLKAAENSLFKDAIVKTTDILDTIKQQRDILFENKLFNGFKDHKELEKLIKK